MKFYFIDKPLNITSFDVIRKLRKILNTTKMGHTGTLDPLATGGLLIAVGKYTKLIPYFEKDSKEYIFKVKFDGITDSYDLGTEINYISESEKEKASKNITKELIEKTLKEKFSGKIKQIPPKYSALKMGGKKALDKVRLGEEFKMQEREVEVLEIELLDYKYPEATIRAKVSAGTYIRSIAFDLGNIFKTGGYVTELRRTKIGNLDIKDAQILEDFNIDKTLDVSKLFSSRDFVNLDGVMHPNPKLAASGDTILGKLNNGLEVAGEFDYEIGKEFFITDGKNITNIVKYDGKILKPIKKI